MHQTETENTSQAIVEEYKNFLGNKNFPCIAAKAALAKGQLQCMVMENMNCPKDDHTILQGIYRFVDIYRNSLSPYHTLAIVFKGPQINNEAWFDELMWQKLQALRNLDSKIYKYDNRVEADPASARFGFSLKEEAFFIIGLHPASNRKARQFKYPTLVFNPHAAFEKLREEKRFESIKKAVRKRDILYSGSVNPMLKNFGEGSEVYQYSGRNYDGQWQCPLKNNYAPTEDNSAP